MYKRGPSVRRDDTRQTYQFYAAGIKLRSAFLYYERSISILDILVFAPMQQQGRYIYVKYEQVARGPNQTILSLARLLKEKSRFALSFFFSSPTHPIRQYMSTAAMLVFHKTVVHSRC